MRLAVSIGKPRPPSPWSLLPAPPAECHSIPRPDKKWNLYSMLSVCLGVSFQLDMFWVCLMVSFRLDMFWVCLGVSLPAGQARNTFPGRRTGGVLNRCWTTSTGSSQCRGAAVLLQVPPGCLNYSFYLIARHTSVWRRGQSTDHMIHDGLLSMTSQKSTVIRWPSGSLH